MTRISNRPAGYFPYGRSPGRKFWFVDPGPLAGRTKAEGCEDGVEAWSPLARRNDLPISFSGSVVSPSEKRVYEYQNGGDYRPRRKPRSILGVVVAAAEGVLRNLCTVEMCRKRYQSNGCRGTQKGHASVEPSSGHSRPPLRL